ncbi:site-2 protease family protein [Candidatus Kaiserbacteria bacterium]|nr:site-2 protease family protein [Candidatus Kaiserbacteria bacterium]
MNIIIFLLVLFVLILVHEWGHFITAKKTGMRVDEFGIGFPPKLFGIKRGETEYSFNLLPIGGFVRIWGENSESSEFSPSGSEADGRRSEATAEAGEGGTRVVMLENSTGGEEADGRRSEALRVNQSGRLIDGEGGTRVVMLENSTGGEEADGRRSEATAEDIEINNDQTRAFTARPKWAQAIVLLAGVTMNVIFAWFLFVLVFMIGIPSAVDEATADPSAELRISSVLEESPAAKASLPVGAKILSLNSGDDMLADPTPSSFREFTESHADKEIEISYDSGINESVVTLKPEKGLIVDAPDQPAVGVSLVLIDKVSLSFWGALVEATRTTFDSLLMITVGIANLISEAVVLKADMSNVAGPVGIVGLVGDAAAFGLTSLLLFTATISLNLAVINLLPFPALDGGRLLFVAIESVTKKAINPVWVMRLNTTGFVLLIALMVAVTYSDVIKLL